MFEFFNTLLIGITAGSIYSLMAIAIVLVWRSTRVVNFAAGGIALASTFVGSTILEITGSFWIALPIAMLAGAAISSFIEYFFYSSVLVIRTRKFSYRLLQPWAFSELSKPFFTLFTERKLEFYRHRCRIMGLLSQAKVLRFLRCAF
jgi:branched-subunit amino acid ABC-type transport system permease component